MRTVIVAAALAIVAAPLAGLFAVIGGPPHGFRVTVRRLALVAVAFVITSAGFTLQFASASARTIIVAHVTLAAAVLALGALGVCAAALFNDPLDAGASSLVVALVAGFGVLVMGPPAGDLPTAVVDAALLASPVVATASAAGIDILRGEPLYEFSPIAHRRFDYPSWHAATAVFAGVAVACVALAWWIRRPRAAARLPFTLT